MERSFDVVALGELLIDFTENGVSAQGNTLFEAPAGHPVMCLPCCESLAGPAPLWARWGTTCLGGC